MIVIMLVVRLCTMVVTCFLIAYSCYKKVLLVFWYSTLVMITHGFKLNEVELTHNIAAVITVCVTMSTGGASVHCVGYCMYYVACTYCCNWHVHVMLSSYTIVCRNSDDSASCTICL